MANLRAIRLRIKSVESTRQITRSMKMVAAAKLRKTQRAFGELRSFADKSRKMLLTLGPAEKGTKDPLLTRREPSQKVCYVLLVGNRGLCGTYNHNLLRYLEELRAGEERESFLWVLGRWGRDQIRDAERRIEISDAPTAAEARALTEELKKLYLSGGADEIVLVYQGFKSVLQQNPCARTLLPLKLPEGEERRDVIYEPDAGAVLARLTELCLETTVRAVLLEGRTGEHAARMTAMTAASDNTEELIAELTLELNHARQAAITTEISEIVGGAAAL
ncbi:MAG: ATP synthase F1 subunit gamma [Oscillospiraceae bacterium]|nr:ATP synthase F1 subunit gamma [Oscillospiraceae bacterium]